MVFIVFWDAVHPCFYVSLPLGNASGGRTDVI